MARRRARAARAARPQPGTVERKIQFYRAQLRGEDEGGDPVEVEDPSALFQTVADLPFLTPGPETPRTRYLQLADGNFVAVTTVSVNRGQVRGVIGTSRRTAQPDVETLGNLRPLNLPRDAGLFEATHFILFVHDRVLGMEYNQYGPRTGRLAQYLLDKCGDTLKRAEFLPILRGDVRERLDQIGEVSLLRLAVHRDDAALTGQLHESLPAAFRAVYHAVRQPFGDVLEIVVRKKPYARGPGMGFPFSRQRVFNFLRRTQTRDATVAFQVKARNTRTEQVEVFDLLEDRFIASARVELAGDRRRSIDSGSMFGAIDRAYEINRRELLAQPPEAE